MKCEIELVSPHHESFYAFRTITTKLGRLQTNIKFTDIEWKRARWLKVQDALAAIIIKKHRVAVVGAKSVDGSEVLIIHWRILRSTYEI